VALTNLRLMWPCWYGLVVASCECAWDLWFLGVMALPGSEVHSGVHLVIGRCSLCSDAAKIGHII
jgi:hypothetical protein